MIQVSNWSEKKCNEKSWLQALICTYFNNYSCKNTRFMVIFVKHTCSVKHQHLQSLQNNGLRWIQVAAWNTCVECAKTSYTSTKYTSVYTPKNVIWSINNMKYSSHMHICVSTILWTCPQKCGHYPNTNFICKIAVVHTHQNTHIGYFLWYAF